VNWLGTILLLGTAFCGVFAEAVFDSPRRWLGAQINYLPPLMVYAALTASVWQVAAIAVCGGLWVDSLSGNPLGVSVLPLLGAGLVLHRRRELLLRHLPYAQFVIGTLATGGVTLLTLVLLLTLGERPLLGWGTLWQGAMIAVAGGLLTPFMFWMLGALTGLFSYQSAAGVSFRLDREIKRGRY